MNKNTDNQKNDRGKKLRSALRENLKKRKSQARKLGQDSDQAEFAVKLRKKDIIAKRSSDT